jgi:hypothetical protein
MGACQLATRPSHFSPISPISVGNSTVNTIPKGGWGIEIRKRVNPRRRQERSLPTTRIDARCSGASFVLAFRILPEGKASRRVVAFFVLFLA